MSLNNLVVNGDFASGSLLPWLSLNAQITGVNSHSGLYSARLQGGNASAYLIQYLSVTPGEKYELLLSLAKAGAAQSPPVNISISYYDDSNNFLGYGLNENVYVNRLPNGTTAEWITDYFTTTIVVPPTASLAALAIFKIPQSGSSDLLVDDIALLEATGAQGPQGPPGTFGPPYDVFVRAGAVGGDGGPATPFGTIQQGIAAVAPFGTVHILAGTYNITSQIVANKQGITLLGEPGNLLLLQASIIPLLVVGSDITVDGLNMTSDIPYTAEFIQVGGNNHRILNNIIYGPDQPLPMSNWVVNRAVVTQSGNCTDLLVRGNIFYSLRSGMYLNPGTTGNIISNVVYYTKGGFLVDQAIFVLSANSWGLPINEVDIALFLGTTTGAPYDPIVTLSLYNNGANISDQR
jgi:hypothetical protein